MLSKVLSGRGREHIEAAVFPSAQARYSQPAARETAAGSSADLQPMRERIQQLEAELAAARRNSFDAGQRQGEQQARAELAPVIERMNASIAEITGLRADIRLRAEKDVVQLALLIARRVLHRELNVDPHALTALARIVFERLARAETYRVTVHPSFVPAITAALPASQAPRVQIEPDPHCAIGSFIIRSDEGLIDASVDSQLEEISRGLSDRLAQSGNSK